MDLRKMPQSPLDRSRKDRTEEIAKDTKKWRTSGLLKVWSPIGAALKSSIFKRVDQLTMAVGFNHLTMSDDDSIETPRGQSFY
ncbi:MAG: hypothetical protein QOI53_3682 [Verrucomicrobiota bacterium]|nr:hypothetical protein [Verrucomicrobiota bacterium]